MAVGEDKVRTLITLTKQDKEDLEKLAKNDNRSLSSYIVNVLKNHMDEIRDSNYGVLINEPVKGQQELKLEYTYELANNIAMTQDYEAALQKVMKDKLFDLFMEEIPNINVSKLVKRRDSSEISDDELEYD